MRRNGTRFALISVGERGHQTLLLRLSAVLRNALVMCGKLIRHCNFFHKTTCPEFRPSLPPGLAVSVCHVVAWFGSFRHRTHLAPSVSHKWSAHACRVGCYRPAWSGSAAWVLESRAVCLRVASYVSWVTMSIKNVTS